MLRTLVRAAVSLCRVAAFAGAGFAATATPSFASNPVTAWQPGGIVATTDTFEAVIAKVRGAAAGAGLPNAPRVDRFEIVAGSDTIDARAQVTGYDYAIAGTVAGKRILNGRHSGVRWRRNSAGTVHLIRGDVQGDDFDRWPVTQVGFDLRDCVLLGTATTPASSWVLADRPAFDIPRFLYIDRATGDVIREVSREGTRVVTYDFSDVRGAPGQRRAYAWTTSGAGEAERVSLVDSSPSPVGENDVAVPAQGTPEFSAPPVPRKLTASTNRYREVHILMRVDGKQRDFVLDTGTSQLLVPGATALETSALVLNHGTAATLDVDDQVAHDAPFLQAGFSNGLLGYDFFRGRIVHINYDNGTVEVLPRDGFAPPNDALPLATDWSEAMPVVTASFGDLSGSRFQLDTGSSSTLIMRIFADQFDGGTHVDTSNGRSSGIHYLEGKIATTTGTAREMTIGSVRITGPSVEVERADSDHLAIPFDGIIGTNELSLFEWWFDADGTTTWFRPLK